jgi:flagellar motility protein MotE (MotC chaperone)
VQNSEYLRKNDWYLYRLKDTDENGVWKRGMESVNERNQQMYYFEGSAVRKMDVAPRIEERPERKRERKVNSKIAKNARKARAFDVRYMMSLVIATGFLFVSCITMLMLEANVTEQRRQISSLERNLNALTDSNNETSKRLESSVDLVQIYDFAVNDLGMGYPKNGQVVMYKASNPDYVKQFKDIPKE